MTDDMKSLMKARGMTRPPGLKLHDVIDNIDDDLDAEEYLKPDQAETEVKASAITTISKLVGAATTLPVCVRVSSAYKQRNKLGKIQGGDVLMLHCLEHTREVLATDRYGNNHHLPIYASQLFQILPADPRLDDKTYHHTLGLLQADPLPTAVRVTEGFYDIGEDETKEVGDIIVIKELEERGEDMSSWYISGEVEGNAVRYRGMKDFAEYTAMIYPELLPLSALVKKNLPLRVRTADSAGRAGNQTEQHIYRLTSILDVSRVLVSRQRDGALFKMRTDNTTLPIELFTPLWAAVPPLLKSVYPLVNLSLCRMNVDSLTVPQDTMGATPQPLEGALGYWLQSYEGKLRVSDTAQREAMEMQRRIKQLTDEKAAIQRQLNLTKKQNPAAPIPPRDGRSATLGPARLRTADPDQKPQPVTLPRPSLSAQGISGKSFDNKTESHVYDETPDETDNLSDDSDCYDTVTPKRQEEGLARTDLEKMLKSLLDAKSAELQKRDQKIKELEERNMRTEEKLALEKNRVAELSSELEVLKDEEDCYEIMTEEMTSPRHVEPAPKKKSQTEEMTYPRHVEPAPKKKSPYKEHHIPFITSPRSQPTRSAPPQSPLPAIPTDQAPSLPEKKNTSAKTATQKPIIELQRPPIPHRPPPDTPVDIPAKRMEPQPGNPLRTTLKDRKTPPHVPKDQVKSPSGTSGMEKAIQLTKAVNGAGARPPKSSATSEPYHYIDILDSDDPSDKVPLASPTGPRSDLRDTASPQQPSREGTSILRPRVTPRPLPRQSDASKQKTTSPRPSPRPSLTSPTLDLTKLARPGLDANVTPSASPPLQAVGKPGSPPDNSSSDPLDAPPLPPRPRITSSSSSIYSTPPTPVRVSSPKCPLPPGDNFSPVLYETPDQDVAKFTKHDVARLLRSMELDDCVDRFIEESIDGVILLGIDEGMMLNELGMTQQQARKLTIKIDELTSN